MPRYRTPPLTLVDVWQDGEAIRIRDLVAITGFHADTIYQDIEDGQLIACKRRASKTSPYVIDRAAARRWLAQMGLMAARLPASAGTSLNFQPTIFRTHPELLQHLLEFMGLGSIVRSAVATANKVTGGTGGVQASVSWRAWTGLDGDAKPTYAAAVTLQALVEFSADRGLTQVRSATGVEKVARAKVMFLDLPTSNGATGRSEPIDTRDEITLPDGTIGPILRLAAPIDPSTSRPFAIEAWIG